MRSTYNVTSDSGSRCHPPLVVMSNTVYHTSTSYYRTLQSNVTGPDQQSRLQAVDGPSLCQVRDPQTALELHVFSWKSVAQLRMTTNTLSVTNELMQLCQLSVNVHIVCAWRMTDHYNVCSFMALWHTLIAP